MSWECLGDGSYDTFLKGLGDRFVVPKDKKLLKEKLGCPAAIRY